MEAEQGVVEIAAAALDRVAEALPSRHALILAVCDTTGRPSDLLVRDCDGRVVVLAGLAEDRRPDLGRIIRFGVGDLERTPRERQAAGSYGLGHPDRGERLLMHTTLERAPMPLMLVDSDGTIAYAPTSIDDFGYRTEELIGHRLVDFVHPEDRERLVSLLELLRRGERAATTIDMRWRQRDDSYARVEIAIRACGDPPDPFAGGVVVGLRSLPRPGSAPEIIEAAHRDRLLADASDCGVAIVSGDADTIAVVLDANTPLGRLVGVPTGRLIGTSLVSLVADSDVGRLRTVLEATRLRGEPHTVEVALKEPVGGVQRAEVAISADVGAGRNELVVRVRDVTERLRREAELSAAVDRLKRASRELAEFALLMASDATLERAPVDLGEVLERVLDRLAEEIAARDAMVAAGELPTVYADERRLERALVKLISNALEYAGCPSPRVRIEAHDERDAWRISVSDEGIGVPEADRARIFEPFARGEAPASGRGIGLATARRIVELHGGRIWVEPNAPRGSSFHLTLPNEATPSSG